MKRRVIEMEKKNRNESVEAKDRKQKIRMKFVLYEQFVWENILVEKNFQRDFELD